MAPWRDALVLEAFKQAEEGQAWSAVRTADGKYVRHPNGEEELYDLEADPYELENLSANPAWAAEKMRLAARLDELLAEPIGGRPNAATQR
jgi:hypothetical protein